MRYPENAVFLMDSYENRDFVRGVYRDQEFEVVRCRLYVYIGAGRRPAPRYMYMSHALVAPRTADMHICARAIVL